MMLSRLRRLLPTPHAVRENRWLRWIGPALHHPRLWHMSRRGIALGVALGMFFGFLVPIAQIPLSTAAAVLMRANVPCAIASTFVTNPFTFGSVYFAAWKVGGWELGVDKPPPPILDLDEVVPAPSWWRGLAGLGAYTLITWAWWARTRLQRWRRLRTRAGRIGP